MARPSPGRNKGRHCPGGRDDQVDFPDIVYITSFAPDRSEDEIIASNIANQERKEARQRLEEARIEKRREMYRALGQATGIDTDKMEAEIAADRARQEARRKRLLEAAGLPAQTATEAETDPETAAE